MSAELKELKEFISTYVVSNRIDGNASRRIFWENHNKEGLFDVYVMGRNLSQAIYDILNDFPEHICLCCGENETKFKSFKMGYRKTCSNKCSQSLEETIAKVKQTKAKNNNGNANFNNSEKAKKSRDYKASIKKGRETKQIVYGDPFYNNWQQSILTKTKNNPLDPMNRTKALITNAERYGGHPMKCSAVMSKLIDTNLFRYGVNNVFQLDWVKDKSKDTMMGVYGVEYYSQTDEYKQK